MAAIKFDLKNILTHRLLPGGDAPGQRGKAQPFTAYFCRDDKSLWISDAEGNLISISDLLSGNGAPRTFPFVPVVGPQGPAGKDGADSTVPGPIGATGPQGPAGPKGDVLIPNESELAAAVIQLRQQRARTQASLLQAMLDADRLPPSTRAHIKLFLEQVRKDAGL